jgi:arginine/lysine/ornithine decarboxylase
MLREKPGRTSRATRQSGSSSATGASTSTSPAEPFAAFLDLLRRLEGAGIFHRVHQFRDDALAVEVAVPGERWEIEFLADGAIEIEIFRSDGEIQDAQALDDLFTRFDG